MAWEALTGNDNSSEEEHPQSDAECMS